ncbi:hypothetical protein ACFVIM_15355 [Streptomyces sp. NPDC057638]|uniref:hypothetical protein n=1 Tax=Streptomyces sp. NPDC057638 TaxID=3346190 RepID=UPI00368022FE
MGSFARFFRRSKEATGDSAGAPETPVSSGAVTLAGEPGTGAATEEEAPKSASAVGGDAGTGRAEGPQATAAVAEAVEIPRQQSAGEAADSETGEGARA